MGRTSELLGDVRILKLAEMYEAAYGRFLRDDAMRYAFGQPARDALSELGAGDHERRIDSEILRLNAEIGQAEPEELERAALEDVLEIERTAHEFYEKAAQRVHDPDVARLFAQLARDEARYVAIASRALGIAPSDEGPGVVVRGPREAPPEPAPKRVR
ncbi:MAG TPA: hypothetical protein VI997_08285 [Candidatus Thermoplasmatota archaeon]|nr:hypothetical protein [Candidatus Thermoplasmatota archaeon]